MNVGKVIRSLRMHKGWKQKYLAEKAKISQTAFSHIEKGRIWPRQTTIERIAEALQIPAAFIYIMAVEKDDIPAHNRELYHNTYPLIQNILYQLADIETPTTGPECEFLSDSENR